MGIGVVSLVTSQKREITVIPPPGPPFDPNSADNGLSVDATSGRIVLGNDLGDPAQPAELLSDREIVTEDAIGNLWGLILNSIVAGITTYINGQTILMQGGDNAITSVQQFLGDDSAADLSLFTGDTGQSTLNMISGTNGFSQINVGTALDNFKLLTDGFGHILFQVGGLLVWQISTSTFFTQIGPTIVADNGATLQITGTNTRRLFTQSQGAGTYNVDRDLDSDKLFRNSGAANFQLPNMAAANARPGFVASFFVFNVAGITVTAFAGQTIRFGSLATTSGGTISSTDVGAFLKIVNIDSNTWATETFNGAWVLT